LFLLLHPALVASADQELDGADRDFEHLVLVIEPVSATESVLGQDEGRQLFAAFGSRLNSSDLAGADPLASSSPLRR
jgi:hypothetical protein